MTTKWRKILKIKEIRAAINYAYDNIKWDTVNFVRWCWEHSK
jgi:hypothetical protein